MTSRTRVSRLLGGLAVIAALAALAVGGWRLYAHLAPAPGALILVAPMEQSGLVREQLTAELKELPGVAIRKLGRPVRSPEAAREEGQRAKASAVIWEAEDGQIQAELVGETRRVRLGETVLAAPSTLAFGAADSQVRQGARLLKGWLWFGAGQDDPAQAAWESLLAERGAGWALARVGLALLLADQRGEGPEVTGHLARAAELDPGSFVARYDLAAAYALWCDGDGGLAAAVREAEAAIALQPEDPRGHALLGDLLSRQGEPEPAIAAYQAALERAGGDIALWNRLARAYYGAGREQEAHEAFQRVVADPEVGGDQPALWSEMCLAYGYLGLADRAIEACQTALALAEGDPAPYRHLGLVYSLQGRNEQAMAAYGEAATLDDGPSLVALGHLLRQAGEDEQARQAYARAVEVAPCDAEAHLALATLDLAQGDYPHAREELTRGLAIAPHDAQAECALGMACYLSNEQDEAIQAFQRAIALDPGAQEAYLGLGGIYMEQREYEKAKEAYAQAVALTPEAVDALMGLGDAQRGLGALAQAEAAYTTAMRLDPSQPSIRLALAMLYDEHGLLEQARSAYQSALSLQESAAARAALASVYQRLGQLAPAQREYERALALEPGRADYQIALALVDIAQDQPELALEQLAATLQQQPENALAHFLAGLAQEKMGRKDQAIQSYRAALLHSGQDDNLRRNAQAQLSRLGQ
ncbi:MAG: tetratricopeptide repeat protein [Chloroflexi bacterium]|nr:tetratricopeptide repeat protein [Chloroflexota bacterium]